MRAIRSIRTRLAVALALVALVALLTASGGAASLWVAGEVHSSLFEVDHRPHSFDLELLRVEGDRITLRGDDPDLTRPGVFGLEWPGGYTQIGAILETDGGSVTRRLLGPAHPPVAVHARLDSSAYQHDPQSAHGIAYQQVTIATTVGPAPAWYVPGERDTTVILVHGRGARRSETRRSGGTSRPP